MAKTQNFNASVNFGATVDGSVGKTINRLTSGIDDIGSVSMKAMGVQTRWMREMAAGSASTTSKLKHMEQATAELLKKQEALEKGIREGVKSGRTGTAFLVEEYKRVGVAIKRATDEMVQLNREQEREQRRAQRGERFRARAAGFRRGMGWTMGGVGRGLMTATKWAGAGVLGGAAAVIASPIAMNAETAETAGLAKSYGLSIGEYQGLGVMARQAGLNAENGGDLAEEFTNKLKEQGNDKTLNPMLSQLGFNKRMLSSKSREEAFNMVMSQLSRMKDTAAAASLADQLMGGEANKFLTYIHSTGKSFEEAMKDAQRYNLLTQDGADGAMKANTAIHNLWGVAVTGMEDTIGKITGQLAPEVDSAALRLADWLKGEQPKITEAVTNWLKPDQSGETGPQRLWDSVIKFGKGIEELTEEIMAAASKLKWLLPESRTPAEMDTIDQARRRAIELAADEASDQNLGWMDSRNLANRRADEAEQAWKDARSKANVPDYVGFNEDGFGGPVPELPDANSASPTVIPNQTNHNQFVFNVTLEPGTPEDMAQSLHDQFKQLVGGNGSAFSPTYDIPG